MTAEERQSPENGIWLCQNHAKLVDNDETRYSVDQLRTWKDRAEQEAIANLEQRRSGSSSSVSVFLRIEQLMPLLLKEIRNDLSEFPLKRELVVMKRSWSYWAKGNELVYYYDDHADLDDKLVIMENEGLIQDITYNKTKRYKLLEPLTIYLQGSETSQFEQSAALLKPETDVADLTQEQLRILDFIYAEDSPCTQADLCKVAGIENHYDGILLISRLCDETKHLRRIKGRRGISSKSWVTGETKTRPAVPMRYTLTPKGIELARSRKKISDASSFE